MCEFCVKHGEGKKWYLQARSYSQDLANDVRRKKIEAKVLAGFDKLEDGLKQMDKLVRARPLTRRLLSSLITRQSKRDHFGQVLPIEDVEKVFGIVNSIVRIPCVCRKVTVGRDVRYCLGVSTLPPADYAETIDSSYLQGPDTDGMDVLTASEAIEFMREMEKEGAMHSVWTFGTPFIGGVCNCDRSDCLAMRMTVDYGVKLMFKAEYVASVNRDSCTGCRSCLRLCQFGAMGYSAAERKAFIDPLRCYGCGVCRAGCAKDAISLSERASIPLLARNW